MLLKFREIEGGNYNFIIKIIYNMTGKKKDKSYHHNNLIN